MHGTKNLEYFQNAITKFYIHFFIILHNDFQHWILYKLKFFLSFVLF